MAVTRRAFLAAGAIAAASNPLSAAVRAGVRQDPPTLTPSSTPQHELAIGRNPIEISNDRDGVIYLPKGYTPDVVLAPDSREWTWDSILHRSGPDADFIVAAFRSTLERCAVDRRRLAMAGFSDGASHVLSLGIANGDTFGHLMAFSPGLMEPLAARGKPRMFISHGTSDPTMPIDDTSRKFVPRLKALGYDVTYREFDGRHTLPPDIAHDAFKWFIEGSATGAPATR